MTTLRTTTTTEFRKRVYFDGSPTHVFNDKCITPLMKACMHGRPEQVKLILEEKPLSVIERDGVFKTALHYCAENDEQDADCAKLLLDADPSIVDIPDDDGHTALHLAVIAGNLPLVRFLVVYGQADPNKRDAEGHSTVHWATVCADVDALELVLSHGGTTSSADVHGGYAVHYAAQMCGTGTCRPGDVRNVGVRVLQLLLSFGADVHVTDKHGRQPILWAASAGSADAIITLVNGGANVESHDKDGLTALHCAASRGHVECVDALLTLCGSEVDAVDCNSCSALFYAVTLGHADATEILLEHGANPDRQDGKGRTPAHCGAFKGQFETVRILAEHGANLWLRNAKGGYPLHDAMRSGRKELVLWLLSMRPESVDYYDDDGKRPLHIAALNNNLEMSKIVLDSGASINPVMKIKGERMTPLDVALRKSNRHLAKFLNLYGGKPASKLNKTLSKQQSTIRVKTKRTESRRNSYSSDSISRKYRSGSGRKKQATQRKGENSKTSKTSKGRVVQVHIRADVLTKTIGKSRDDKKACCGGTLPKAQRKKASAVVDSKECFSENDLCYGDGGGGDGGGDDEYDRDYDYGYDDDDDDDDDEVRRDRDGYEDDDYDVDDGEDEDSNGAEEGARGGGRVEEQTNGSAAQAAADHCNDGRRRRSRRRGNRPIGTQGGRREPRAAAAAAADDKVDKTKTTADVKVDKTKTAADVKVDKTKTTADVKVDKTKTAADVKVDKTKAVADDKVDKTKAAADDKVDKTKAAADDKADKTKVAADDKTDKTKAVAAETSAATDAAVRRHESAADGAVSGARASVVKVSGSGDTIDDRPRSPAGEASGDVDRNAEKTKPNAETATSAAGGVVQNTGDGKDDGRRTELTIKVDDDNGRVRASVAASTSGSRDGGPAAHDNGPTIVAVIRDDDGKDAEPPQSRRVVAAEDRGDPPAMATTTAKGGTAVADKTAVGRTTSTEGGKSSKTVGGGGGRAIVEILDRVDTPPQPPSVTVAGDDEARTDRAGGGAGDIPVAFSVLPNRGRDDAPLPCDCPDCAKKPKSKRSSTKKMKSRIPRLNNYCSLAPTSDLNTMSVTKAVQLSSRKYHLERLIFYQLSELKRFQIRAGKSDERVLVKRLVEEYGRTGMFTGLKRYDGPFSFKRFEKYLYDQLLVLQRQSLADSKCVIPRVKTIEEIDKLTGALRRIDAGKTVVEDPNDCLACIRTTNRCFHATHAYTGVPCAAYIPKFRLDHHQMPKPVDGRRRFLPDIRQQHQHDSTTAAKCSLRNVDPSRPITLQLAHGPCTQAIDLPTDKLDKNKRYLVTFTIKGAADGGGQQNKHRPTAAGPSSFRDSLHHRHHHGAAAGDCHPPLAHTHAKSF